MPVSLTIDMKELEELKNYILATGLRRTQPTNEYELLRIEDGNVKITVYKSGKVVHNDTPESRSVIGNIIQRDESYTYVLGSDEVGKGEWYGPLVVCCVAMTPSWIMKYRQLGIRDSKTLPRHKIYEFAEIMERDVIVKRFVILDPTIYNKKYEEFRKEGKKLNELLAWAHSRAIKDTLDAITYDKARLVIDKFDVEKMYRRLYGVESKNLDIIQKSKGETETPVAAAGILAKSRFEDNVDELNQEFNLRLRSIDPSDVDPKILPLVAKMHFKNVRKYVK